MSQKLNESIEVIKAKVLAKDYKLSKQEELHVIDVYAEITKISTGKPKVLNVCCGNLITGYKIIGNYINFHMQPESKKPEIEIKRVEDKKSFVFGNKNYKQLLKEAKDKGIKVPNNIEKDDLLILLNPTK
jgi:hypothetical protein